jgi:hypothetical protein
MRVRVLVQKVNVPARLEDLLVTTQQTQSRFQSEM